MSRAVNDLEDLRQRSVVDDVTGCWHVQASHRKGSVYLWLPVLQAPVTLTKAMAWLMTGKAAPAGQMYVAMCGNTGCGNPAHRKLGGRDLLMRVMRPRLDPAHRAKIQQAHLRRSKHYSPERRAYIMQSDRPARHLAAELGMDATCVARIRRGDSWQPTAHGASAFHLGTRS